MLLQFRFKNYKSFKEETIFDMTATSLREHPDFLIEKNGNKVLPVSVLYGANANGKSNFFNAFTSMMGCVVRTFDYAPEQELPIIPYIFVPEEKYKPTEFEIYINIENKEYQYGFILDYDKIYEEWLYEKSFRKNTNTEFKMIFERKNNQIKLAPKYEKLEEVTKITGDKNLFLSILGRRKEEPFSKIYKWCLHSDSDILHTNAKKDMQDILNILYKDPELFNKIKKELKEIDSCIYDMRITEKDGELKRKQYVLYTVHQTEDGKHYSFPFSAESKGTQNLFILYFRIFLILYCGGTLLVDELDSSIHGLVLKNIIKLFQNRETNPNNAQVIFSCHSVILLNRDDFRRDQIWFVNKDKNGVSTMFALSDLKIRSDLDYEKAYLAGRFGAIPFEEEE